MGEDKLTYHVHHIPVQFVPVLVQSHVNSSGWDPSIHTSLLSQGISASHMLMRTHIEQLGSGT